MLSGSTSKVSVDRQATYLEELVGVLLLNHQTRGLDDVADVLDELHALERELGLVDGRVAEDVAEGVMDLLVRGKATITEGLDDAVELELERRNRNLEGNDKEKVSENEPCARHPQPEPSYRRGRRRRSCRGVWRLPCWRGEETWLLFVGD